MQIETPNAIKTTFSKLIVSINNIRYIEFLSIFYR